MLSRKFRTIAGAACLIAPLLVAATPVMAQKSTFIRSKPTTNIPPWYQKATVQNALVATNGNHQPQSPRMPRRAR
jgi:hypothetical protein